MRDYTIQERRELCRDEYLDLRETWGETLRRYYQRKVAREVKEMEEAAKRDLPRLIAQAREQS